MSISKQKIINNFKVLINECNLLIENSIKKRSIEWEGFTRWRSACQESLALVFTNQGLTYQNYQSIIYLPSANLNTSMDVKLIYYIQGIKTAKEILEGAIFLIDSWWQDNNTVEPIKVLPFISYGGKGGKKVANKIKSFLSAFNIQPIIAEEFPNLNLSLDKKIEVLMSIANMAIIVMTGEDKTTKGEVRMRQNVLNELSELSKLPNISNRIINLKTEDVVLPSNIKNKTWYRLNLSNLETTFINIVKEMKMFGFSL